jgi:hypothetical protein
MVCLKKKSRGKSKLAYFIGLFYFLINNTELKRLKSLISFDYLITTMIVNDRSNLNEVPKFHLQSFFLRISTHLSK